MQLLRMLDEWTEYIDSGGQIHCIYTDLEKAFDKVPHKKLISKLASRKVQYTWSTIISDLCNLPEICDSNGNESKMYLYTDYASLQIFF